MIAYKENISCYQGNSQELSSTILMDEGEELGVGHVQRSTNCPITRMTMVEPVRNKTCGHTYSKEGML